MFFRHVKKKVNPNSNRNTAGRIKLMGQVDLYSHLVLVLFASQVFYSKIFLSISQFLLFISQYFLFSESAKGWFSSASIMVHLYLFDLILSLSSRWSINLNLHLSRFYCGLHNIMLFMFLLLLLVIYRGEGTTTQGLEKVPIGLQAYWFIKCHLE